MASKQELIDYVADRTELSKLNAAKAITYYISEGTPVHISNFGTFEVRKRAARVSHDVHSREKILVGEQNIPVFRAGKALKLATKQELSDEDMVIETLSNMILEVQHHD
ncbi:DNA-binding protein HU [Lactococcus lactis subsp. lactis NCDO 2118]|uniref:DNA-binding protein HU n=1 Tax=Lactococcus lactis subsp. lactis NCDO 2118 TaxID=1117941 RepID=A0ABC8A4Y5_LACLL|nr:HU family DNA-binding protein [Lactococcus lactis]ADA64634.1 DNA-binding protein HU [Lactococcus lactis subsp. lactis KF147]AII12382.1 DNA-binding protein HU [Lactococcus lactis subsp. lactis NCDO 2118]